MRRRTTRPISSTASSIARATRQRPGLAVALDERRQLVPPARDEPAVAPGRPAAADVGLEQDDPGARRQLRQPEARSTARCTRRRRRRRRRSSCRAAAARPRPSPGCRRAPRRPAPRAATTTAASPLGRTPRRARAQPSRPAAGRSASTSSTVTGLRDETERRQVGDRRGPAVAVDGAEAAGAWAGPVHESIVASRIGRLRVARRTPAPARPRSPRPAPPGGSAVISSIARSVAATNAAIASRLVSSVSAPTISPGPGSGVMSSTRRTVAGSPVSSSWTGSLLAKPGRGVDGALRDGGALAEVGVLDDRSRPRASGRPTRAAPGA